MPDPGALEVLVADELLRREAGRTRTTPRWQAAMARAAARLQRDGAPWKDLRLPIAAALVESYPSLGDEALVAFVEVLLPIEESELASAFHPASPDGHGHGPIRVPGAEERGRGGPMERAPGRRRG